MGEIISFVGQKGGTGKSTLARAFAVEAARAGTGVVIADLDEAQRTSWDWGRRRAANDFKPAIPVEMVPRLQLFTRAAQVDVLIVDAPGWTDASTAWLAQGSQLTVLPTGTSVDDLNPTIRLMHELKEKGLADWRLALALCRVHGDADAAFARDYLKQASYRALNGELREKKAFADLQNLGRAVTEGPPGLSREAFALVEDIAAALDRAQKKAQAAEREAGPARLVRSADRSSKSSSDRGDR
jgi:chromosome partitioning protein